MLSLNQLKYLREVEEEDKYYETLDDFNKAKEKTFLKEEADYVIE